MVAGWKADRLRWGCAWADRGNPEQLTHGEKGDGDPSWSPNGDAIAFGISAQKAGTSKEHPIQILNLKSHKLSALPDSGGYFSPRWSPDGRWILAVDGHPPGGVELFNIGTGKWEELTKLPNGYPDWSRDSRCIYFNGFETPGLGTP